MPLKNTWIAGESYAAADHNAVATDVNTNTTAIAGKEAAIAAGTAAQYWRGDKSWQTLDKAAAGLGNVDNTSNATERATAATLTNKTLDNTNTVTVKDANLTIQDDGNPTKQAKFEAAGITAGQTRILTLPDASTNVVGHDTTQTLTNKTIPIASNTITGTLPVANGGTGASTAAGALINLSIPADFILVQTGNTARAVGSGDFAFGHYVGRAFTATSITYQFDTADASGNTTVELRRNGSQVTNSSIAVSAANQADGTGTDAARTATISQSFSVGDRINLQITGVGTTPGKGLRAWIVGTWN